MSEHDEFMPDLVDEQIDAPASLLSAEDARLVQDLSRSYRFYKAQNERSLDRVWQRLTQSKGYATSFDDPRIVSITQLHARRGRKPGMDTQPQRSRGAVRIFSALAAVVVIALLLGSMLYFSGVLNKKTAQHVGGTTTGSANGNGTVTVPAFNDTTPAPGIYITSEIKGKGNQYGYYNLNKIDPKTHAVLWSYNVGSVTGFDVKGDTVYVGSSDDTNYQKFIYAINAHTGKLRWKHVFAPDVQHSTVTGPFTNAKSTQTLVNTEDLGVLTTPEESNGIVYTMSRSGKIFALSAADGKDLWMTKINASALIDGTIYDAPQLSAKNGMVYGMMHNLTFALDATTGKLNWSTKVPEDQMPQGLVVTAGAVYTTTEHVSMHTGTGSGLTSYASAFNAKTGTKLWQHPINAWLVSAPAVMGNSVYVGAYDFNVYALNAANGSVRWTYNTGGEANYATPIVDNGVIYVNESGNGGPGQANTESAALLALNAHGHLLWRINTDANLSAVENGVVYGSLWPRRVATYSAKNGGQLWVKAYGDDIIDKMGNHNGAAPNIVVIP